MSETVIPTMCLRYVMKPFPFEAIPDTFEYKPVLQQRFDKASGGHEWRDVPTVVEDNI